MAVTVAAGIAAPLASATFPANALEVPLCAKSGAAIFGANITSSKGRSGAREELRIIFRST
jgi:hypothetical protein